MHILIWLYDLTLFRFVVWLYNIWITSMFFLVLPLQNIDWAKSLRHSAWLIYSVFQLLKTQVKAKKLHSWR
jgi:hypothetical protein